MPGPVSDSYDPEFSTAANAEDVHTAIQEVVDKIGRRLGSQRHDIVGVVHGKPGKRHTLQLSERELRVIRFALSRAQESIL